MLAFCFAPSSTSHSLAMREHKPWPWGYASTAKSAGQSAILIRLDCFLLTHFGFAYFPFFGMALRVIAVMLLLSRFSVP
jgi:hypothetical protein